VSVYKPLGLAMHVQSMLRPAAAKVRYRACNRCKKQYAYWPGRWLCIPCYLDKQAEDLADFDIRRDD
jgi:hypothetical protein